MTAIDWLLGGEPAIRWQALRDLTDATPAEVAAERARVATEGWAPALLALRQPDGLWHNDSSYSEWLTLLALALLRDMGLDPASDAAREAIPRVRDTAVWHSDGSWGGNPLFVGEVEPCINGRVVAVGAYFGVDVAPLLDRLLGEQMADGGWNCEQENGSIRGSFHTSINVLEGLDEYRRSAAADDQTAARVAAVERALAGGNEYLLERRLLHRLSTGEVIDPDFSRFVYPPGWHYDALRALDYFRAAGVAPDPRMAEAIAIVRGKLDADGRLALDAPHEAEMVNANTSDLIDLGERAGQPSRWNTLRGLRVLRWFDGSTRA